VDGQTTYESRRKRYETAIAEHTLTKEEERNSHELFDLLEGKGFCDVPDLVERTDWSHRLAQRINAISPGPRNEYGFMSEAQRFSFAYRQDDGSGFSAIVPLGLELRAIGGWLVGKTDFIFGEFKGKSTELRRWSYGATYSPSASRFADWYVAVAHEGTLEESGERRWHVAEELGVRLRFAILKAPLFKFYGGRIGVRAEGLGRFENVRLVFELGAGAW
jgi:hypothetical protein